MGSRGSYSSTRKRKTVKTSAGRKGQRNPNPMDTSQFEGKSLEEIEDGIRSLGHERLFVLGPDGKVLKAYDGKRDSVAFYASDLGARGATVTHNHPLGSERYGGTFSTRDVLNMASSDWGEHRAVAGGRGEFNYIMRRTSKTTAEDGKALYNRISKDTPMLDRRMKDAANRVKGLSAEKKRQVYTGILDRYYKKTLPQYNFEYITRGKAYKYNR